MSEPKPTPERIARARWISLGYLGCVKRIGTAATIRRISARIENLEHRLNVAKAALSILEHGNGGNEGGNKRGTQKTPRLPKEPRGPLTRRSDPAR